MQKFFKNSQTYIVKFKHHGAFTLAEVLITLAIIGVVAALTIPTLVNNYQKTQYVTSLKKTYTQFNQVLSQMAVDAGCTGDLACMSEWGGGNVQSTGDVGALLTKYLKITKNCKDNSDQGCMPSSVNQKYDGTGATVTDLDSGWTHKFITLDGMSYRLQSYGDNCVFNSSNGKLGYLTQICGDLIVDINGPTNGPNRYGRDLFYFFISNGKGPFLYPSTGVDHDWWHWQGDYNGCNTISDTNLYCSARIMEEDWQMKY